MVELVLMGVGGRVLLTGALFLFALVTLSDFCDYVGEEGHGLDRDHWDCQAASLPRADRLAEPSKLDYDTDPTTTMATAGR